MNIWDSSFDRMKYSSLQISNFQHKTNIMEPKLLSLMQFRRPQDMNLREDSDGFSRLESSLAWCMPLLL